MNTSYPGRVVRVNLSDNKIERQQLSSELLRAYLGGRGVGVRLLWDDVAPDVDPFDEGNALMFLPGVLTGTSTPCSGRTTVSAKGPATGQYLKTSVGGYLGIALKMAGVDAVVVQGIAEQPTVLVIDEQGGRLEPAGDTWGQGVKETTRRLKQRYGDDVEVACIGPAGEKLVRFAAVMTSVYNAAARGGIGAVMGSKRLKAIVIVPGRGGVRVHDPDRFSAAARQARELLYNDSVAPDLHKYGTARDVDILNELRLLPTRNFQRSALSGDAYNLSGRSWPKMGYLERIVSCGGCIYCCHRFTRVSSGPYAGTASGGPEYETVAAFGSGCGILELEPVLAANALCNDLGLDTISAGNVVQWAMETAEKGILTEDDLGGLKLSFGDAEGMLELLMMIGERRGVGDVLAEGVARAADKIGHDSHRWAVEARGLEQSNVELRGAYSYALAFAVNPRGPDHLHTECLAEFGGTNEGISLVEKLTGDKSLAVPDTEIGRAKIVRWHEDMYAVTDAVGMCAFSTTAAYSLDEHALAELVAAATGQEISGEELMKAGKRILTLERCFSLRHGLEPSCDDRVPRRMMEEIPQDVQKGEPMDRERLSRMLKEYYELHGWDPETGRPLRTELHRLGLDFAAEVAVGPCEKGGSR